jgi:hypothetical protein
MRKIALCLFLLLAACAERWEKPGATEADSDAAQAELGQHNDSTRGLRSR